MRNVTKGMKVALPALVAAGFATMLGVTPVKGDFLISVTNPQAGTSPPQTGETNPNGEPSAPGAPVTLYTGVVDDYVISALNTGTNGSGSTLQAVDVTITINGGSGTTNALVFDTYLNGRDEVDVDGRDTAKADTYGFGDPLGGTYVAIGNYPDTLPDLADPPYNPRDPNDAVQVQAGWVSNDVYVNGANVTSLLAATKTAPIDANFTNNTVQTFELVGELPSGGGTEADAANGYVPFANIVVPHGVSGTALVKIGGEIGSAGTYTVSFGAPVGPTISLSTTAPAGSNSIATVNLTGSHGSYVPQTVTVTGAATTNGYLTVNGFSPTNDEEIYGLGGTGLAGLAATLNAAVTPSGASVVPVSTLSASLQAILTGDTLAAIFPTGSNPAGTPNYFAYNLQGTTATITSITVVPEPTGIGALVLGGIGLLSRRKTRKVA